MSWGLSLFVGVAAWALWKPLVRRLVRWRLGPNRVSVVQVDPTLPLKLETPRSVAVIGGGLAGIAAATTLGARGYAVTIFEARSYLGGKLGAWPIALGADPAVPHNHGFHAFFRHYYNLNRFLDSLGLRRDFRSVGDYRILRAGGEAISFGAGENTPVLNLLAMAKAGVYRLSDVLGTPTRDLMGVFLEYDPVETFRQLDRISFADFDRLARLPPRLRIAFRTFARAFFADEDRFSMAELVRGFHVYYLGHEGGLVYDHPTCDFEAALLAPIRTHLATQGVKWQLGAQIAAIGGVGTQFEVGWQRFDSVVLATDVVGARAIAEASPLPGLDPRLRSLRPGQRYAVLRLWLDRRARESLPAFVITERERLLDAIAFTDRLEAEWTAWSAAQGGSVIELHSYAVPDDLPDAEVRGALVLELDRLLPELAGASVKHEVLELRRDFTAFHVGMDRERPGTDSGVAGLVCAGDWVKLPFPAMLMEAAFASGLVAANRILGSDGLRAEPIDAVPPRGVLAGVPQSPARKRLLAELSAPMR